MIILKLRLQQHYCNVMQVRRYVHIRKYYKLLSDIEHANKRSRCNHYKMSSYDNKSSEKQKRITGYKNSYRYSNENYEAHEILLTLPSYKKTTIDKKALELESVKSNCKNGTILEDCVEMTKINFKSLSKNDQEILSSFLKILQSSVNNDIDIPINTYLNESHIIKKQLSNMIHQNILNDNMVLYILLRTILIAPTNSSVLYSTFFDFFLDLQNYCMKQIPKWNYNQMLLVADIWYHINIDSSYNWEVLKKLEYQLINMEHYQIVQYFFYLNVERKFKLLEKNIQDNLKLIVGEISINELGIVAIGLFKSQTPVQDPDLLDSIFKILEKEMHCIAKISLSSILKLLKYSLVRPPPKTYNLYNDFLRYLSMNVETYKYDPDILVLYVSLGNNINLYNKILLQKVSTLLCKDLSKVKLKYLERLMLVLSNSGEQAANIQGIILSIEIELKSNVRYDEIENFPLSFLSCILYITFLNHISPSLISKALRLNDSYKNIDTINNIRLKERNFHLIQLEGIASLEGLNDIHSINKDYIHLLKQQYSSCRIPMENDRNLTKTEKLHIHAKELMKPLGFDDQQLIYSCILPFFRQLSLVFCTDQNGDIVDVDENFNKYKFGEVMYPIIKENSSNITWNALILGQHKHFLHHSQDLKGEVKFMISRYEKIGFSTTLLPTWVLVGNDYEKQLKLICQELSRSSLNQTLLRKFI